MKAGVLTISDSCARGERDDLSGAELRSRLAAEGFEVSECAVLPDERAVITETLLAWCGRCDLILTTGGTGLAPRDVTPEATASVLERSAPGIAEMLRFTGYQRNPRAVLARGLAGVRGRTLIVNLPGSPKAVSEALEVLLPLLPHALALLTEQPVDH